LAKREPFIPGIKADAQLAVLNNEAGRQAEHKRHLDELGFPEYVEPDFMRHAPVSYDDPCNPTPSRIVNQAGQDLGDANREDSPHHSMYEYKPAKKIKKEFIQAIVKEQADEIFLNKVDNVSDQTKKFDTTKIGSQATYATETAPSSLPTGAVSHSTYKDGVETSVYGPQGASARTREKAGGAGPYITRRTTFKPTGTGTDTGTSTGTDAVGSAGYYKKLGEQYKTEQSKDEKFMDFSMDKNMIKSIVKEQADGIFISKKKPKATSIYTEVWKSPKNKSINKLVTSIKNKMGGAFKAVGKVALRGTEPVIVNPRNLGPGVTAGKPVYTPFRTFPGILQGFASMAVPFVTIEALKYVGGFNTPEEEERNENIIEAVITTLMKIPGFKQDISDEDSKSYHNLMLAQASVGGTKVFNRLSDERQAAILSGLRNDTDRIWEQARSAPVDDVDNINKTAKMIGDVVNTPDLIEYREKAIKALDFKPITQNDLNRINKQTQEEIEREFDNDVATGEWKGDEEPMVPPVPKPSSPSEIADTTTTKPVKPASEFTTPPPGIKYKTGDIRTGGFEVDTAADKAIQQQGLQRVAEIQRRARPVQVGISQPNLETTRKLREADAIVPLKASMTKAIVKEAIGEFFL